MVAEAKDGGGHKIVAGANDGAGDLEMLPAVDNGADDLKLVTKDDDQAGGVKMVAGADDDGASSAGLSVLVPASDEADPLSAKEILVVMKERMNTTTDSNISMHRFPYRLRGIGGQNGCYVVPGVVAIGPYHHEQPHLLKMEEMKHAAALNFCNYSGRSVDEVYERILAVAGEARRCYDLSLVACLSDAKFAAMMFLDGCFLLSYMADGLGDKLLIGCNLSSGPSFLKDIFLLENQIPWLVLEALMELRPEVRGPIIFFVSMIGQGISYEINKKKVSLWLVRFLRKCRRVPEENTHTGGFNPQHLLGLLRFTLIQNMPPQKRESRSCFRNSSTTLTISAVDLAQKGVKLAGSTAGCFAEMNVKKTCIFGELSLSPLSLDDTHACWLVNLAALEAAEASSAVSWESDGYVVSSYLSLLAMLMDREEDVHELRRSDVLRSRFSNTQTLVFFKGISQHLRLGYNYFNTLDDIEDYMKQRPLRVTVHKFLYNNYRTVAAVLSIAGVLIGIFKAIYSLKHS